jgi:N-terminal half of MaoC dehydratase
VAISEAHAGRRYPPTAPYAVSATKIGEFARALCDDSPAYAGDAAIAPPTFAAVIANPAWQQMFTDPELELALSSIVHGDQRFDYRAPLRAGDVVSATLTIDKVRVRAGSEIISSSVVITGADGAERVTATATFLHARAAA